MLDLLAGFIQELRNAGLPVSLTENLDAMEAVKHIPLEDREAFKFAPAATLVKNASHWKAFETVFEVYFSMRGRQYAMGAEDEAMADLEELAVGAGERAAGAGGAEALTREELAELYVVRASLEHAAITAAVSRATDADVGTAAAALRELEAATARGGSADHHRWSRRFHLALLAPCQMHRLLRMLEGAWNVTEPGRPMSHASPEATAALAADHVGMLDAFAARDTAALVELTDVHYRRLHRIVADLPADP